MEPENCDASHAEAPPCWPEWTPPSVGGCCLRETEALGLSVSDTDCWGPVQARAVVAYSARDGWTLGRDSHFRPGGDPAPSGDPYRDVLVAEELAVLAAWRASERERASR